VRAGERTPRAIAALACWLAALAGVSAQSPPASGEAIYRSACLTCHGPDGRGSPRAVVGFATPLPDFTDCAFASAEADIDWFSVVHEGGPVRGLARHMPAFGDALSDADIDAAVAYLRRFCANRAWPAGDLNLPRAFFTEKAFPENEVVYTTAIGRGAEPFVGNEVVYERRLGARNQIEAVVPVDPHRVRMRVWERGVGETQACGSGACAVAVAAIADGTCASPVTVEMPGGDVEVGVDDALALTLTGTAQRVYTADLDAELLARLERAG